MLVLSKFFVQIKTLQNIKKTKYFFLDSCSPRRVFKTFPVRNSQKNEYCFLLKIDYFTSLFEKTKNVSVNWREREASEPKPQGDE